MRGTAIVDLLGRRFGRLEVTAFLGAQGAGDTRHRYWMCRCDCGSERKARASHLARGLVTQCAACGIRAAAARKGARRRLPEDEAMFRLLLAQYRTNARVKGLEFTLGAEEARGLFSSPCWYCGAEPTQVRRVRSRPVLSAFNGIDRVDSKLGYVAGNVVPCCGTCNYAKRKMAVRDFLAWVDRVYSHQRKNGRL